MYVYVYVGCRQRGNEMAEVCVFVYVGSGMREDEWQRYGCVYVCVRGLQAAWE